MIRNQEIRAYAKDKGVKLWELAECFGYTGNNEANFTRKLRVELSQADKEKAKAYIDRLASERG